MHNRRARYGLIAVLPLAVAALLAAPTPAMAADLGTLTVTPNAGGSVTASPMFTSAATSVACPTGYGTNAALKVGPVGGPYKNLVPIGALGTYANAPFSLSPNRSLSTAMGGSVPDGKYELVVICVSDVLGDNPDVFRSAPFSVSNGSWSFGAAPSPSPSPQASPSPSPGASTSTSAVSGAGLSLRVVIEPSPGTKPSASHSPSQPPKPQPGGGGNHGGLPVTGLALGLLIAGAVALIGAGLAIRLLARRRANTTVTVAVPGGVTP